MSTLVAPSAVPSAGRKTLYLPAKLIASAGILTVAVAFVLKYVFRYDLHYSAAAFTDPDAGAPNYWSMRAALLPHMTGGMVALLTGPFQFWTGFRVRYARLHRWMGRIFLGGVAVGTVGAFRMAVGTSFGWAWGFSLIMLDAAWFTSAAMALYAILKGHVQVHKEWMVRTYVVTFAFVMQRVLSEYYPGPRLQPDLDRATAAVWTAWVLPIMFTELILQLRRMKKAPSR